MATLAERLRPILRKARAIPGKKGFRVDAVYLLDEQGDPETGHTQGFAEKIALTEADGQPVRVKILKGEDVPFGNSPQNIVRIGPVTRREGRAKELLFPTEERLEGQFTTVLLVGENWPAGERFRVIDATVKPLGWLITAQLEDEALKGF